MMLMMLFFNIKFKKLNNEVKDPLKAYQLDAGWDLFNPGNSFTVKAHDFYHLKLGIALEMPEGTLGLIQGRSGLASRHGITTIGNLIDAGYRGEISVTLANLSNDDHEFKSGEKVCQVIFFNIFSGCMLKTNELSQSSDGRGSSGFGSTGQF